MFSGPGGAVLLPVALMAHLPGMGHGPQTSLLIGPLRACVSGETVLAIYPPCEGWDFRSTSQGPGEQGVKDSGVWGPGACRGVARG